MKRKQKIKSFQKRKTLKSNAKQATSKVVGSGNHKRGTLMHLLESFEDAIETIHAYGCTDSVCIPEHYEATYALIAFFRKHPQYE